MPRRMDAESQWTISITPGTCAILIIGLNYVIWKLNCAELRHPEESASAFATNMPLEMKGSRPWNTVTWVAWSCQEFSSCSVIVADQFLFLFTNSVFSHNNSHQIFYLTLLILENICRFICIIMLNKHDLWNGIIKQLYFRPPLSQFKSILWGLVHLPLDENSAGPLIAMAVIKLYKVLCIL